MAHVVIFPDRRCFELASQMVRIEDCGLAVLEPPEFCKGLATPCMVVSGGATRFREELRSRRIPVSGMITHRSFGKEAPQAPPPDGRWREILGSLFVSSVKPSLTDPLKLRAEIVVSNNYGYLIPIIARLIRGGSYSPGVPILAFEEEHRLICLSSDSMVFSRVDDLLDLWIMLRCAVDLITAAWDRRFCIKPDTNPRQGIGAIEIFKRLPATNCRQCNNPSCMEFAAGLLTGRCTVDQCVPLAEGEPQYRESLLWLMGVIGLAAPDAKASKPLTPAVTDYESS